MFESAPSLSNDMPFAEVIERLASSDQVEGIALFGSTKINLPDDSSDYDLLILIREPNVHIFQMHTWIDGISADVVFVTTELAERVLEIDEPISATSPEGFVISWMEKAQIHYEKEWPIGMLSRLQDKINEREWRTFEITPSEVYNDWFWLNFDLRHIQRLARSNDPIHLMTADIRLMAYVSQLPRTFMRLRALPWKGEKAALRYLQASDLPYFEMISAFLAEPHRSQRVEICERLIAQTLAPIGQIWAAHSTAFYLQPPSQHPDDIETGLKFWTRLLKISG